MYDWIQNMGRTASQALALVLTLVAGADSAHGTLQAQAADTTPPSITTTLSSAPNAAGWHRANVRVRFVCADTGGSGVAFCPPAVTVTTEGAAQVVAGTARDRAGNVATASVTINLDRTPPVVSPARAPLAGANGWVSEPVVVSFTATDALSGVKPGSVTPDTTLATTRVGVTVRGRATDLAGNVGTAELSGINIDLSKPRVTLTLTPDANAYGYRNQPVTAHFTCVDSASGVASCPTDQVFAVDGRSQIVTGTATDNVGLTTTVSRRFHLDQTPPVVTTRFSRPPDAAGWYGSAVTASFTCADAVSGIATCPAPVTMSSEGASQQPAASATDRAGNTAASTAAASVDLTPPTVSLATPTPGASLPVGPVAITGSAGDTLSGLAHLTINGQAVAIGADGTFTFTTTLTAGAQTFMLLATDRVGHTAGDTLTLTGTTPPPPPPVEPACTGQMTDGTFEVSDGGFYAQQSGSVVARVTESPIEGTASLRVIPEGWGANIWWDRAFQGGRISHLRVSAHLRSDVASSSTLNVCAMAYFQNGEPEAACTPVSGALGDKGMVTAELTVDSSRPLAFLALRMWQEGSAPMSMMVDEASVCAEVVAPPVPDGGNGGSDGGGDGGSDGGGNGGGGGAPSCSISETSVYPGFTYALPTARPFVPLTPFTSNPNATAVTRLVGAANAAIGGNPPYGYAPLMALLAYRITNQPQYLDDAIARVDQIVTQAEADIAAGQYPALADDSYLHIGWYLENLALVYDHAHAQLTPEQRQRWAALADQAMANLWHPAQASWGGVAHPWTGWAICDPGNNYHFSFLRATMLWALASQNTELLAFLQTQKFPPLLDYYAALPGGGTREGTGYGSAVGSLFLNYLYWKTATGEALAAITPHPKQTIDYWVHATVPTRDRFAPIADLSRESVPNLYDYQENLVHTAVQLAPGTPEAARGTWWLQNNSVNGVAHVFNIAGDLLPYPDAPQAPTALAYHSPGAGALFARTSWATDAAWISVVAGKNDQSHAHYDQGSFTFFKGDWLAVTNNIWSYSGLHPEVEAHNVIRFERADGTVISQNQSSTLGSTMTSTVQGNVTTVVADLANAYSANTTSVQAWTRTLVLAGDTLRVTDACTIAAGVRPIFQIQVPVAPVLQQDGSILAGHLRVVPMQPVTFASVATNAAQFTKGYRMDLAPVAGGCAFDIELQAVANPASDPAPDPGPGPAPDPGPSPNPGPNPAPSPVVNPPACATCTGDPVEPVWHETGPAATRIKSPAQHMHFTTGAPIRILADARDPNAWMCPPGHPPYVCPGSLVRFYVDGQLAGSATPSDTDFNLWEMRLPNGLPQGHHVLTVAFVPYDPSTGSGGTPVNGQVPVTIHVDPPPAHASTVELSADLVLSGATNLDWTDVTVVGNGFTVTAAPGYSGHVQIQNAFVTGLGTYGNAGINVATTGTVSIQSSVFEATGAMRFAVQGSASLTVRNNELRANNLLTYVSANPDVPVALELGGSTTGVKSVQGNRIGAGMLRIRGGQGWQIGGLAAGLGNVLIGPRAVLHLVDTSNNQVQGNYLRHDYHGGFSQGFNLWFAGSSDQALVEHNVIRGGSWPVQTAGGTFRYNLVVDSGHNFWRSARANTVIHHNVFAHTAGVNTGFEGVFKFYGGETGVSVYNNTFDVGGSVAHFDGPAFNLGAGVQLTSIRNNLFTRFSNVSGFGGAFVSAPGGSVPSPRVASANYNAWFNPLAAASVPYLTGIVAGAAGLNDVIANPALSGTPDTPYRIAEGCLWTGGCSIGQALAHYRGIYQPAAGSPLIQAGDPADGVETAIGAIGPNTTNAADRFGLVVP